jgi:alpha-methylacyl-CoA racemase
MRVVEFGSIGPGPFAAMMLADMGAQVVRIERGGKAPLVERGATVRGREVVQLDLKDPSRAAQLAELIQYSDVLIEGFRPGVMERLGFGPDKVLATNQRLVYARMTGWGQEGPLAQTAGHDIDYIAITGALHAMGDAGQPPMLPLNLVGDYGGGALYLVAGILAAYIEAGRSGKGQVVDAAICDGAVSLMSLFHRLTAEGEWSDRRGSNSLDGSAPFYRCYECRDGRFVAVGAIEPQFYAMLREIGGWSDDLFSRQHDRSVWPQMAARAQELMRQRTRDEWAALFDGTDACVAPVLTLEESKSHPHLRARKAFVEVDGEVQPAPAPRFSRTTSEARASKQSNSIDHLLAAWRSSHPRS